MKLDTLHFIPHYKIHFDKLYNDVYKLIQLGKSSDNKYIKEFVDNKFNYDVLKIFKKPEYFEVTYNLICGRLNNYINYLNKNIDNLTNSYILADKSNFILELDKFINKANMGVYIYNES